MEIIGELAFATVAMIFFVISKIQTITIIAISILIGTIFGTIVTVTVIKSSHTRRSSAATEEISVRRQDTLRSNIYTTEPTYLNVNYSNPRYEKTQVQDTPVYAEVGPGNDLLFGLPQGYASAPPRT